MSFLHYSKFLTTLRSRSHFCLGNKPALPWRSGFADYAATSTPERAFFTLLRGFEFALCSCHPRFGQPRQRSCTAGIGRQAAGPVRPLSTVIMKFPQLFPGTCARQRTSRYKLQPLRSGTKATRRSAANISPKRQRPGLRIRPCTGSSHKIQQKPWLAACG